MPPRCLPSLGFVPFFLRCSGPWPGNTASASVEERARRRHKELLEKGQEIDFETVKQEIADRDYADSHRAVAPLKQAEDAVVVDTSSLDLDQSLEALYTLVKERLDL